MCLFLLMINESVVSSFGIVPPVLHNHLWIYPRVSIANISTFTGHHSRKMDLVNSNLQQEAGGGKKNTGDD